MKKYDPPELLSPRSSLYGGRTSTVRLRYTAAPNETVCYKDINSLYPYVNAMCSFPLSHPTIIHNDFEDPQKYFGLIRAIFYPPRGLFFPVLPYKISQGKQEASGYPPEAVDEESRKKYIREYELHQGIRLNPEKIEANRAKRQCEREKCHTLQ
ncbi:hypothetical protein F2P81_007465 [Scophthalmus maximus]|uniref:DNA-directed DNA polymerase n=1 Tax=Scophthalmus maximus TaxID=52904 RepID=A0A6A4T5E9_SCOMX|nr:hypothetical protein F2P81_007465 [Scophthalmus maximus]